EPYHGGTRAVLEREDRPALCATARSTHLTGDDARFSGHVVRFTGQIARFSGHAASVVCCALLAFASHVDAEEVTAERLLSADEHAGEWLMDGRTYSAQRFSPLEQINEENVSDLGLAWYYELDTLRGVEATPLMIGGVLYNVSAWNVTYAHDAKTGELLWTYDS